ncbi:MAG: flagellar basal body P-ring formation protein FlgA [Legionellaceae bacterium]|nr:flagellar basal body P-ring formation protein FlgA [Legionellaceae bacterium]
MKYVLETILLLCFSTPLFAELSLRFQPNIPAQPTRLDAILAIQGESPHCRLGHLPVPKTWHARPTLDKQRLLSWLARQQLCPGVILHWLGKTQASTQAVWQSSPAELQHLAEQHLRLYLQEQHFNSISLDAISPPKGSTFPLASFQVRLPQQPTARLVVWLENAEEAIPLWFSVRATKKVWLARRSLAANSPLLAEDFVRQEKNAIHLQNPATELPPHSRLKGHLAEGAILTAAQIEPQPPVRAGQPVNVLVQQGSIRIHSQGIALQDGNCRQRIRIQNPNSQQIFYARVRGENQVEALA